ncbi:MAG: ATP-binding protein, partial [Clostridium sp.]|nr:ATP-binding protein [Clostridium sp.]
IDEYDTPIIHAYTRGYKKELGDFFTVFYGTTLKDNAYLEKAVLSGIQRVAKENIFSGLNNLHVCTVTDETYATDFGLTKEEVAKLLAYYGRSFDEKVRECYDGYCFGGSFVYNPWSIMNFARDGKYKNYWTATSSNALIEEYLNKAGKEFFTDFDRLASQRHAKISVDIDMALQEFLGENEKKSFSSRTVNRYLWGLLVNAGYLTYIPDDEGADDMLFMGSDIYEAFETSSAVREPISMYSVTDGRMNLRIPNGEVYDTFRRWALDRMDAETNSFIELLDYLNHGDTQGFSQTYSELLENTISYYDTGKDNRYIYHALFLGMCMTLGDYYHITSNREHGDGRPDIRMESRTANRPHIIVEIKSTRDENCGGTPLNLLKEQALQQIHHKNYYSGLSGSILCLGLAHDGKTCEAICELIQK